MSDCRFCQSCFPVSRDESIFNDLYSPSTSDVILAPLNVALSFEAVNNCPVPFKWPCLVRMTVERTRILFHVDRSLCIALAACSFLQACVFKFPVIHFPNSPLHSVYCNRGMVNVFIAVLDQSHERVHCVPARIWIRSRQSFGKSRMARQASAEEFHLLPASLYHLRNFQTQWLDCVLARNQSVW